MNLADKLVALEIAMEEAALSKNKGIVMRNAAGLRTWVHRGSVYSIYLVEEGLGGVCIIIGSGFKTAVVARFDDVLAAFNLEGKAVEDAAAEARVPPYDPGPMLPDAQG